MITQLIQDHTVIRNDWFNDQLGTREWSNFSLFRQEGIKCPTCGSIINNPSYRINRATSVIINKKETKGEKTGRNNPSSNVRLTEHPLISILSHLRRFTVSRRSTYSTAEERTIVSKFAMFLNFFVIYKRTVIYTYLWKFRKLRTIIRKAICWNIVVLLFQNSQINNDL